MDNINTISNNTPGGATTTSSSYNISKQPKLTKRELERLEKQKEDEQQQQQQDVVVVVGSNNNNNNNNNSLKNEENSTNNNNNNNKRKLDDIIDSIDGIIESTVDGSSIPVAEKSAVQTTLVNNNNNNIKQEMDLEVRNGGIATTTATTTTTVTKNDNNNNSMNNTSTTATITTTASAIATPAPITQQYNNNNNNTMASPTGGSATKKRKITTTSGGTGTGHSSTTPTTTTTTTNTGGDKANKGLRHFSMKVCRKVEEKGCTTYNEVADELVQEFVHNRDDTNNDQPIYDEKNIRRRVYDALNVLMAMDIISKEKKEIRWKGLPSNAHTDMEMLTREKSVLEKKVMGKTHDLQELLKQQIAFKRLIQRNRETDEAKKLQQQQQQQQQNMDGADNNTIHNNTNDNHNNQHENERIQLPFVIITANPDTVIECEISDNKQDVFFNFNRPFHLIDDGDLLKQLEMHKGPRSEIEKLVRPELIEYLPDECFTDHNNNVIQQQQQEQQLELEQQPSSISNNNSSIDASTSISATTKTEV